ncbi:MAG: hypothetical protein WCY09_07485 [Candidatus Omnitrophota bacterium]
MNKKAQATLEFTLTFVIMVTLLFGLIKIWKGSSDKIIKAQLDYNSSRKDAGGGAATYDDGGVVEEPDLDWNAVPADLSLPSGG